MVFDIALENLRNRCASTKHTTRTAAVWMADVALAVLYVARAR